MDADNIVDRRRLKRKLTFWRLSAVVAAVIAAVVAAGRIGDIGDIGGKIGGDDHVARLDVSGIILEDYDRDRALDKLADDGNAKALVVYINSPGGTVVGGEDLFHNIRKIAGRKPVVALMGSTATSAGYMTALAADHIIAREGTVTGSIGVLMQSADMTGLLDKLGIKPENVKSHPLKAQPNPLEPFSEEAREAARNVVMDLFNMFVDMVVDRRKMNHDQVMKMADGRVFTGRQAKENGLIDAIGGEFEARRWLNETHKISDSLPLRNVDIVRKGQVWRDLLGANIGKILFSERLGLDGPISIWHPDS